MPKAFDVVASLVVENLPDSISRRKQVLGSLLELMPENHPLAGEVKSLLDTIKHHEFYQSELPLNLRSLPD